jgi:hypothetical protein
MTWTRLSRECSPLGATKYNIQPNDHCRVYADPAGHPFCLSTMATADLRPS